MPMRVWERIARGGVLVRNATQETTVGRGAAGATLLAALLAVEYAPGTYDSWDLLVGALVGLAALQIGRSLARDLLTRAMASLSLGIAAAIAVGFIAPFCGLQLEAKPWPELEFSFIASLIAGLIAFGLLTLKARKHPLRRR